MTTVMVYFLLLLRIFFMITNYKHFSGAVAKLGLGDIILSIDGQEINIHSLTILALQNAAKLTGNLTNVLVVQDLLLGPKGSLDTLILKRKPKTTTVASEDAAQSLVLSEPGILNPKHNTLENPIIKDSGVERAAVASKKLRDRSRSKTTSRCCWR